MKLEKDDRIQYEGETGRPKMPAPPMDSVLFPVWCREYCKAIMQDFSGDSFVIANSTKYLNNRKIALGKQDTQQYKDQFPMTMGEEGQPGNFVNLDYTPLKLASKFFEKVSSIVERRPYLPNATAIDPVSQSERRAHMNMKIARIKAAPFIDKLSQENGREILPMQEGAPRNMDEFNQYKGSWKHSAEIDTELLIDYTFNANRFEGIRSNVIDDIRDCGIAAVLDYVNPNGTVKIERIAPEELFMSETDDNEYRDIWYAGRLADYDEAALRVMAGDHFTEAEYQDIKKQALSHHWTQTASYGSTPKNIKYKIAYITWVGWVPKKAKKFDVHGNEAVIPVDDNYTPKKLSEKEEMIQKNFKVWYEAHWIVGTKYIFKCGMMNDIKRDETDPGECDPPIKIFRRKFGSIVEAAEPHIHALMNAWMRIQNHIGSVRPDELAIDEYMLSKGGYGKGGKDDGQVIRYFNQKGVLYYSSLSEETGMPMNFPPAHNLGTDNSYKLVQLWQEFDRQLDLTRMTIGLDQYSAGKPPADTVVAAMKQELIGTDHALWGWSKGVDSLTVRCAEGCIGRYQVISKHRGIEGVIEALGVGNMRRIEINNDISMRAFGFKIDNTFSGELRETLIRWVEALVTNYTASGGQTGISLPDAEEVIRTMQSNPKLAMEVLSTKISKREKEKKEMEMAKMQNELQKVQESQTKSQEAMLAQIEADKKAKMELEAFIADQARKTAEANNRFMIEQIRAKGEEDRKTLADKNLGDLSEKRLEGEQKKEQVEIQVDAQKVIAASRPKPKV